MVIQEMTRGECLDVLARTRVGRLACAHENQPYVVPIYFVYEEPYLYGFTTPGQKVEWMRSNAQVCVELDEVDDSDQWTSVVVFGRYEELPEASIEPRVWRGTREAWRRTARPAATACPEPEQARLHAHELLQRHAVWWEPGCASSAHRHAGQPMTPLFYRIRVDRISGRRAEATDGRPVPSWTGPPAWDGRRWLGRFLHALAWPFTRATKSESGPDRGRDSPAGRRPYG